MQYANRGPHIPENAGVGLKSETQSEILPEWHAYPLDERHAPWKVFLPFDTYAPILAVNLKGSDLASLGRSWRNVHVYGSSDEDMEWAKVQGRSLGQRYTFERLRSIGRGNAEYCAVALSHCLTNDCSPANASDLLLPGGAALWVGKHNELPSIAELSHCDYQQARRYAILRFKEDRFLIPLQNPNLTRAGLDLYAPVKWSKIVAVKAAKWTSSLRCHRLLGQRQVVVGRKPGGSIGDAYLLDRINILLQDRAVDMAVNIGWTKLVLQMLGAEGHPVAIAKVADVGPGYQAIERENVALEQLEGISDLRGMIPRLLLAERWGDHVIQVQTAIGSRNGRYTMSLTDSHIGFLRTLSGLDRAEMPFEKWHTWEKLREFAIKEGWDSKGEAGVLWHELERSARNLLGKTIPFHRIHGDFAPWHTMLGPDGLTVIDWELSVPSGLPFYDAAYFLLARDLLLRRKPLSLEEILSSPQYNMNLKGRLKDLAISSLHDMEILRFSTLLAFYAIKYPCRIWQILKN